MIPKTIHYCWFGGAISKEALKCIDSWRKYLPDYEIREWNESNFDVSICPYVAEAYEKGMYAYVSDYARFRILYHHGGLYFDTDVEVIADMCHIIDNGPFMGIEKSNATNGIDPYAEIKVASGLGMGAEPLMPILSELIGFYDNIHFDLSQGTVVSHTTRILRKYGFSNRNEIQKVAGFTIYPDRYFCPLDSTTGILSLTPDTVSIHHYACSWMNHNSISYRLHLLKNISIRLFGPKFVLPIIHLLK